MEDHRRPRDRALAWGLLAAVHVALAAAYCGGRACGTAAAHSGFPLDDAWIHMVYGRALAEHGAPFYNAGTLEAGFTSPLWMACVAVAHLVARVTALPVVLVVKAFGVALAACASGLLFETSLFLSSRYWPSLVAGLLLAAHPFVAFSQVSGMETSLAGALLLATAAEWLRGHFRASGWWLALACLARPEAAVLLPLAAAAVPISRERSRAMVRATVPAVVALGLWGAYCFFVTRHPLPNTFYAKHDARDALGNFGRAVIALWFDAPTRALGLATLLVVAGAAVVVRSRGPRSLPAVLAPWVFVAGVAATRHVPADAARFFYFLRYLVPALPLAFLPLASGIVAVEDVVLQAGSRSRMLSAAFFRVAGRTAALVCGLGCCLAYPADHAVFAARYSWNCRNIDDLQVRLGKWLAAHTPVNAVVLSDDAGAIRYFGDRTTIDLLGLNDHELLFGRDAAIAVTHYPRGLAQLAALYGARFAVIHPAVLRKLADDPELPRYFALDAVVDAPHFTVASEAEGRAWVLERRDERP